MASREQKDGLEAPFWVTKSGDARKLSIDMILFSLAFAEPVISEGYCEIPGFSENATSCCGREPCFFFWMHLDSAV